MEHTNLELDSVDPELDWADSMSHKGISSSDARRFLAARQGDISAAQSMLEAGVVL